MRNTSAAAMSAKAPNVCTGGSVALDSNDPTPCIVTDGKKNKMAKILKSPADNSGTCNVEFDSVSSHSRTSF